MFTDVIIVCWRINVRHTVRIRFIRNSRAAAVGQIYNEFARFGKYPAPTSLPLRQIVHSLCSLFYVVYLPTVGIELCISKSRYLNYSLKLVPF
jgi:hypothetical protein